MEEAGQKDSGGVNQLITGGMPLQNYTGHTGFVSSLADRGHELISGAWDGTCRIWDSETCACKLMIEAGAHAVYLN